ncbi:alpha/beta hydrolase [Amylibacter sp.]|nr:alpha/beta hydrolase [Amylibacter sp.]
MKKLFILAIILYSAAFGAIVLFQNKLIYPFDPTREQPELRITEFELITPDDETLIVWVTRPHGNQPTILYFHGNAGNLANRAQRFDRMIDRGYGLVALGYRGSSGSTGTPNQPRLRADSALVHKVLDQLVGNTNTLIFYGESLGTTVAIHLATRHQPDALILEAPFTSLKTLAPEAMPYFPTSLGLNDTWDSLSNMPEITAPLLVLHGTTDTVVPYEHGQEIFAAAASKQKTFHSVDGLGHGGHWSVSGQKTIYKFIDEL